MNSQWRSRCRILEINCWKFLTEHLSWVKINKRSFSSKYIFNPAYCAWKELRFESAKERMIGKPVWAVRFPAPESQSLCKLEDLKHVCMRWNITQLSVPTFGKYCLKNITGYLYIFRLKYKLPLPLFLGQCGCIVFASNWFEACIVMDEQEIINNLNLDFVGQPLFQEVPLKQFKPNDLRLFRMYRREVRGISGQARRLAPFFFEMMHLPLYGERNDSWKCRKTVQVSNKGLKNFGLAERPIWLNGFCVPRVVCLETAKCIFISTFESDCIPTQGFPGSSFFEGK